MSFHRTAIRITLHGPFRLFRPGYRARLREHYPTLLAIALAAFLTWFFKQIFFA